jgi:hypothetical protein
MLRSHLLNTEFDNWP